MAVSYEVVESLAVTQGPWKLVHVGPRPSADPRRPSGAVALFRILEDPDEARDVAREHPRVVQELLTELAAFRALQPEGALVPTTHAAPPGWRPPARWRVAD